MMAADLSGGNSIDEDAHWMRLALSLAVQAASAGEVPVGAVVVRRHQLLSTAANAVESNHDAVLHAEIIALQAASCHSGDWRLNECTLYVTKEPCAMCAGAAVNCRIGRIVFGAHDPRMGACGGAMALHDFPGMLHRIPVTGGVCEAECAQLLRDFFRSRRCKCDRSHNICLE